MGCRSGMGLDGRGYWTEIQLCRVIFLFLYIWTTFAKLYSIVFLNSNNLNPLNHTFHSISYSAAIWADFAYVLLKPDSQSLSEHVLSKLQNNKYFSEFSVLVHLPVATCWMFRTYRTVERSGCHTQCTELPSESVCVCVCLDDDLVVLICFA